MGIADSMKKAAFSTAFSYIGKNPEENAPKLMAWSARSLTIKTTTCTISSWTS